MKWLSLEWIKAHSRIDFNNEDSLLELYGSSAESTILNLCNRTAEDLIDEYGEIPPPLYEAALMLVEMSYTQRSPVSQTQPYPVLAFDIKVKPYMKLTSNSYEQNNNNGYGCKNL